MLERIDALSRIAMACENETRAVLNAVGGKVDPTMSLHSLFGHRSLASVKKGIEAGDIVGHEKYTDMNPMQRSPIGSTDIRHVLISTCEATGYRQVHGLVDLTQGSLYLTP